MRISKTWLVRIAVAVSAFFILYNGIYMLEILRCGRGDFTVFWVAGEVMEGATDLSALDIYNQDVFKPLVKEYREIGGGTRFLYPPPAALIMPFFSATPYIVAFRLWAIMNLALMLAGFYLSILFFAQDEKWYALKYSALLLLLTFSFPVFRIVHLGQIDALVWAVLLLGFYGLWKKQPHIAGGALAVATVIKLFPLVFVGYLVIKRQWRALGWYAFVLGAFLVAGLVVFGMEGYQIYYEHVFRKLVFGATLGLENSTTLLASLKNAVNTGAFAGMDLDEVMRIGGKVIHWIGLGVAALMGWIFWRYRNARTPMDYLLDYSAIMLFIILFSNSNHAHYHLWVLPLLIVLVTRKIQWRTLIPWFLGVAALVLSQYFHQLPYGDLHSFLLLRPSTAGLLLLLIYVLTQRAVFKKPRLNEV